MKKVLLLFGCWAGTGIAQAQSIGLSTINAAGNSIIAGGNTYEWSVGEMTVVSTFTNASLIVTQGVLQPSISSTGVDDVQKTILGLRVLPNPVTDGQLFISSAFKTGGTLSYYLTDMLGKTVGIEKFKLLTGQELQTISMNHLANGQYNLSIEWSDAHGKSVGIYKIQKIN